MHGKPTASIGARVIQRNHDPALEILRKTDALLKACPGSSAKFAVTTKRFRDAAGSLEMAVYSELRKLGAANHSECTRRDNLMQRLEKCLPNKITKT